MDVSIGDYETGSLGTSEGTIGTALAIQYFIISGDFQEWMSDNENLKNYIQEVLESAKNREKEMNENNTES